MAPDTTGVGVGTVGVAWRKRERERGQTPNRTNEYHTPLATASKLLGETDFALLVNGSVPFGHHSALSGCEPPAVVVGYSLSGCDCPAVVVGYSLSGCDSPAVVVGCGGFWTAAVEPVTVCSHHIRHLQPQLWPPPATPSLAGWWVAPQSCC